MKKIKIIAVDDDKSYLDFLVEFFSKYKERYLLPKENCLSQFKDEYNVEYLLTKIKEVKPDVVLMDFSFGEIGKPEDYGIELVQRIRMAFPDQPVIMLTLDTPGMDEEARMGKINRSFDAGALAYIGKEEIKKCFEAINEVLSGDVFVSDSNVEAFRRWRANNRPGPNPLTKRQREVLQLLSLDYSIGEAADKLIGEDGRVLTQHVVNFHLKNIKQRLNTRTLHGTIAKAIKEGII